ncbi:MAG: response regulator [Pyrinomonadaceae bacterium]|nr:response regulator [Pyrinomonadaceae bacterium]
MTKRILCIDDEPNILEAYKRNFRKDFDICIAEGGEQAISLLHSGETFPVVVCDMQMPGMNGVQVLRKIKEISPDTVRIMLTGNSDLKTAMDAVNEGSIFRFITKPCPPEDFLRTLNAGIEHHRLITAEKELLENTLSKSLQALIDVLSLVNPTAFERSSRVKQLARKIADHLCINRAWEVELAAMLSQIGCITVPESILEKVTEGKPLSEKEIRLYQQHPQIGHDLIARIPRMETVADMISNQNRRINDNIISTSENVAPDSLQLGAQIIKAVLDYDALITAGANNRTAIRKMSERAAWYNPRVFEALRSSIADRVESYETAEIHFSELQPGMILDEPIFSHHGVPFVSEGQEISLYLVHRLSNFADLGIIPANMRVRIFAGMSARQDGEPAQSEEIHMELPL